MSSSAPRPGAAGAAAEATAPPQLSVVVPVHNEAANIAPLLAEIAAAVSAIRHEIIYIDDGSTDSTLLALRAARRPGLPLRILRHDRSCGQSAAIISGVKAARGRWIATLDGDGQNDPADIPRLLAKAEAIAAAGGRPLVIGHRLQRRDSGLKRGASRIANWVRARLLGDATPDSGCGLKIFPRDLFLDLPHFDHMHRFLPALVLRAGGVVVSEPVNHRPRRAGRSHYGTFDRLWVGLVDLGGVAWLMRRGSRPVTTEEEIP